MRPYVGVTCSADDDGRPRIRDTYVVAVLEAGGLPVALPFVRDRDEAAALLERVDALVLTGSEDLDPVLYGQAPHAATVLMHPARMASEVAYARAAWTRRPPTLAICGGMQTLAVVAGGTLHQHVPDLGGGVEHAPPTLDARHPIEVRPGTRLHGWLGPRARVNSRHHQAVATLPATLLASARSPDGLIEALESPDPGYVIGVEWHPEQMLEEPGQRALFEALVHAAAAPVGA